MTKPRQAAQHERIEYQTLDGNWTVRPEGYCSYHHRYLTERQIRLHRCMAKHGGICGRYQDMKGVYVRRMKQEAYFDRVCDRLTKIESALNKMARAIEHISTFADMLEESYREYSISKAEVDNSNDMMDDGK